MGPEMEELKKTFQKSILVVEEKAAKDAAKCASSLFKARAYSELARFSDLAIGCYLDEFGGTLRRELQRIEDKAIEITEFLQAGNLEEGFENNSSEADERVGS